MKIRIPKWLLPMLFSLLGCGDGSSSNDPSEELVFNDYDWAIQFGTTEPEWISGFALGPDDRVYVAGSTGGAFPSQEKSTVQDIFVTAWEPDGTASWVLQWGLTQMTSSEPRSMVYAHGQLYVLALADTLVGNEPPLAIQKVSTDGTLGEVVHFPMPVHTSPVYADPANAVQDIAVADDGDIFYAGTVREIGAAAEAAKDLAWVGRMGPSGELSWDQLLGAGQTHVFGLALSAERLAVCGRTNGAFPGTDFSKVRAYDAFVLLFDLDGNLLWAEEFGAPLSDLPPSETALHVAFAPDGSVYAGGFLSDGAAFYEGAEGDGWIALIEPDGTLDWVRQFQVGDGQPWAEQLLIDDNGDVLVGGTFGIGGMESDAFVARFSPEGELLDARGIGVGSSNEFFAGMALDSKGRLVVAGNTDFGLPELTAFGFKDFFVVRY